MNGLVDFDIFEDICKKFQNFQQNIFSLYLIIISILNLIHNLTHFNSDYFFLILDISNLFEFDQKTVGFVFSSIRTQSFENNRGIMDSTLSITMNSFGPMFFKFSPKIFVKKEFNILQLHD